MDIKETIESGSLELYVMGALTPVEMLEIDVLRKTHPELNEEISRIEDAMIAYADSHAIKPKEELKEKIAEKLQFSVKLDMSSEMVDSIQIHLPGIYRYAAAAAIAFIVALAGTSFYFAHQYNETSSQLASLQAEKQQLSTQVRNITGESDKIKAELAVALQPENKKIPLLGTPASPNSKAVIYWNKESGTTYVNTAMLPEAPTNEQYQLWAMVNGKPVDVGVISKDSAFAAMKIVQNATAFAITLEPLGGTAQPTTPMLVLGSV